MKRFLWRGSPALALFAALAVLTAGCCQSASTGSDAKGSGKDKSVASERTVIWMADATNTLHEFACLCAEDALRTAKVEDVRCWQAIETKRKWLRGEATDDELTAAWDAAWAAARAAARAAQNIELERLVIARIRP